MIQTPPVGKLDAQIQLYRAALNAYRQNVERCCVGICQPLSAYRLLIEQTLKAIAEPDAVLGEEIHRP